VITPTGCSKVHGGSWRRLFDNLQQQRVQQQQHAPVAVSSVPTIPIARSTYIWKSNSTVPAIASTFFNAFTKKETVMIFGSLLEESSFVVGMENCEGRFIRTLTTADGLSDGVLFGG